MPDGARGPDEPAPAGPVPRGPLGLGRTSLMAVARRTAREFKRDNLTDWAAALTYWAVLSIFPGLLVLVSVLGLLGQSVIQPLLDQIARVAPEEVDEILTRQSSRNLLGSSGTAGVLVIVGLVGALWAASGYVSAFMRAANAVYDVPEGRPVWKILPIRLGVTVVVGVLLGTSAVMVVFTGRVAAWFGELVGAGRTLVTVWDIAKWPVLVLIISVVFAILYWAAPNARLAGVRWVSPGGLLAVLIWLAASAGFAAYVANFASYNRTYGTLGGIIVFLVWLWISNLAVLLGAELNAELHRARAIAAGHPEHEEPFLDLRDARKVSPSRNPDLV